MKYKSFILDPFQEQAFNSLTSGKSVVVSAATGTGKTLIADFIINRIIKDWKRENQTQFYHDSNDKNQGSNHQRIFGPQIVYTAPLKALSNQKYREFTTEYGLESVGILTGDVQINATAPLLIMTTEIYRNMLISGDNLLDNLEYTIFDEVHYLSDFERGTIWEEAIIFSPDHVKFLCLSATIPNATEFANWIRSIKGHSLEVINWTTRAVPLKHMLFDKELGLTNYRSMKSAIIKDERTDMGDFDPKYLRKLKKKRPKQWRDIMRKRKKRSGRPVPPHHFDLISELHEKKMLPALIFSFSRKDCQNKARELANNFDFSTAEVKAVANELFKEQIEPELHELESVQLVHRAVLQGVGVHHAGLLPGLKIIVEKMFSLGLLKVLYATETFALGVNMPARSVGFINFRKYDGFRNRFLYNNEYFQCAGRAGRRGIDEIGYVITMMPRMQSDLVEYNNMTSDELEPIISQFTLSYNTVINLVKNHPPKEREEILKSSFDYYIRKKNKKHMWVMRRFNQFLKILNNLGYIMNEQVTKKGEFASKIYTHELAVTELFETGLYQNLDNIGLAILLTTIMYEERRNDHFKFDQESNYYERIVSEISINPLVADDINYTNLTRMCLFVRLWYEGLGFTELLDVCNLEEGDVIHIFRNTLDLARQVRHATKNQDIINRMKDIIESIDRDVVQVSF